MSVEAAWRPSFTENYNLFLGNYLGLNQYDFEGSMLEPVEQFFRKFGGTLTPYYSVSWIAPSVKLVLDARSLIGEGLKQIGLRKR